ncbi:testis-specific H1 histone [Pteronotus mesoamericanus]|uniref:testis-specific H1 histone n=1 Tax=Pteronotus mesoamericanus TaxID=1884717 RepID=UPI0023EB31C1|nr:testis-specific H1 histone [Pteronotus parnellii mesoamericanus]
MTEVPRAVAEVAEPSGESQGTLVKTQQPTEKILGAPPKRDTRFVLRVSEVLLRAITSITSHNGLTLATLKKEMGHAGYQMRRKCCRRSGEAPKSDFKGTLMRISSNNGSGYFRVWKIPKPKRKPGRPRLGEGVWSPRRTPAGPRVPRKRRVRRQAAKKAREIWRRNARAEIAARKSRPRGKNPVRSRAKKETRTKVTAGRSRRTVKEGRPRTLEKKKPREKKKQDPEKPVERTIQRSPSLKTDSRAARPKASTKFESPRNAAGNP